MQLSNDYLGKCSMLLLFYLLSQTGQEKLRFYFSKSMFSDRRSTEKNVKSFFVSNKTRFSQDTGIEMIPDLIVYNNGLHVSYRIASLVLLI